MNLEVCYVVNSVSQTSVPATIATAVVEHEGIDVDILAWFDAEPFRNDARIEVHCLDAPQDGFGLNRRTYSDARDILQQYDLIQTHTNHSGAFAKIIASRLGKPIVSREGNTRNGFTRKGRIANGVTNALADRIVPNSQAVYDSFRYWERLLIDNDKVNIIPNGVDIEQIDAAAEREINIRDQFAIPEDAVVVGTAAVLTRQKAVDILVESTFKANQKSDQKIHTVITGDGPRRKEIKELAADLDVSDQVHITGMVSRDRVYQILNDIDIYVMPSRWEGFAMASVEALGAGKPCIFSDIDPFVIPYRNVAMFHRVNDAEDLAIQLVDLIRDAEMQELYGRRGRALVKRKYTLEHISQRYAEMYESLV